MIDCLSCGVPGYRRSDASSNSSSLSISTSNLTSAPHSSSFPSSLSVFYSFSSEVHVALITTTSSIPCFANKTTVDNATHRCQGPKGLKSSSWFSASTRLTLIAYQGVFCESCIALRAIYIRKHPSHSSSSAACGIGRLLPDTSRTHCEARCLPTK